MTAFNEREHAMMWGIYGELETMNNTLRQLLELLERQEQERQHPEIVPHAVEPGLHARAMEERRRQGLCLVCGATRVMANEQRRKMGVGCYKWAPADPSVEVWAPHSWLEDELERG